MVGEGLWKRQFASAPGLVGRTITLNGIATAHFFRTEIDLCRPVLALYQSPGWDPKILWWG
jgi:hypothetical protein